MNEAAPRLFATFKAAVGDAAALLLRMPGLVVLTVAMFGALRALDEMGEAHFGFDTTAAFLWRMLSLLVGTCAAATPIAVVLSRHIVLGEPLSWASLRRRRSVLPRAFVAIWLVYAIMLAPSMIATVFGPFDFSKTELARALLITIALSACIVWGAMSLVRLFLFPIGVAVEERGASLRAAWASTAGQAWRMSLLVLPIVIGAIGVELWFTPEEESATAPAPLAQSVLFGGVDTVCTAVLAALAARIYLWRPRAA